MDYVILVIEYYSFPTNGNMGLPFTDGQHSSATIAIYIAMGQVELSVPSSLGPNGLAWGSLPTARELRGGCPWEWPGRLPLGTGGHIVTRWSGG
jgi:predicted permease